MKNKNDIIWLDSTDSTNAEAKRRISELDNLSVLSTLSQTKGRGQAGNTWSSDDSKNLLFSIVIKFGEGISQRFRAYDQFAISQIASLAVTDFLSEMGIEAKIKWPNDIYVNDRKICGILIENSLRGKWLSESIVGIGLNINQKNFDVTIHNPTSLSLETNMKEYDIHTCLEDLTIIFRKYWERYFIIEDGLNVLSRLYLSQMWRMDEMHQFRDLTSGIIFTGIIRGITDFGHLIVEDADSGTKKEFGFKEIGYLI